jgi:hypothetical protein
LIEIPELKLNPEFEDKRAKWHVSAVRAVG